MNYRKRSKPSLPSKPDTIRFTEDICITLFPEMSGPEAKILSEEEVRKDLDHLLTPLYHIRDGEKDETVNAFVGELNGIRKMAELDAGFIEENDPAASCLEEVVMTYPGFYAILVYRIANMLYKYGVPMIPRIMSEHVHSVTGIDIHPGATIGKEFCIDHGTGIVIGETTVIGTRVKIYQGVTLGALSVKKSKAASKRHPTIEDNVIIYAGSAILGGKTVIGHDSVIGGNVWLTKSVPPCSLVQHESKISIGKTGICPESGEHK